MIDAVNHMACQFWIMTFWSAMRACSLTDLSSLYLAFSMMISLMLSDSITLRINKGTLCLEDRTDRTRLYRSKPPLH
jgi:hypothetical protein